MRKEGFDVEMQAEDVAVERDEVAEPDAPALSEWSSRSGWSAPVPARPSSPVATEDDGAPGPAGWLPPEAPRGRGEP